ncbi:hypothetical protein QTN25_005902 [Entamoeba marina]
MADTTILIPTLNYYQSTTPLNTNHFIDNIFPISFHIPTNVVFITFGFLFISFFSPTIIGIILYFISTILFDYLTTKQPNNLLQYRIEVVSLIHQYYFIVLVLLRVTSDLPIIYATITLTLLPLVSQQWFQYHSSKTRSNKFINVPMVILLKLSLFHFLMNEVIFVMNISTFVMILLDIYFVLLFVYDVACLLIHLNHHKNCSFGTALTRLIHIIITVFMLFILLSLIDDRSDERILKFSIFSIAAIGSYFCILLKDEFVFMRKFKIPKEMLIFISVYILIFSINCWAKTIDSVTLSFIFAIGATSFLIIKLYDTYNLTNVSKVVEDENVL